MDDRSARPDTPPRLSAIAGIEETAYTWDIAAGRLHWEPNAAAVLGIDGPDTVTVLERHMSSHSRPWHDDILNAQATGDPAGEPYTSRYKLRPYLNDVEIWVEDRGRWWPGPDGRPAHARGVIRVFDGRLWEREPKDGFNNQSPVAEMVSAAIARAAHTREKSALLLISVTNLTRINASFGVSIGDEIITSVARLIQTRLGHENGFAFHASNTFGVVLDGMDMQTMRRAAERLISAVREAKFETSVCPLTAAISVGGLLLPDQAATATDAMSKALEALERARLEEPAGFVVFEEGVAEEARQRNISAATGVFSALEEGRMHFVLQPIVSAETRKPVMYECLLRIRRPDGRLASAAEFIRVAEELGMARNIDMRTLELAVALLEKHRQLKLSLNVSGYTAYDQGWAAALHRHVKNRPGLAKRLMIEITETAMVQDLSRTSAFIEMLRAIGCPVAIDDFGAGYTSFAHLTNLNIDVLKIDGALVTGVPTDHQGHRIVRSMIEVAKAFKLKTVAEWVGDEQTATLLREAGVDFLQGYLYGAPLSVDALLRTR